MKRKNIKSTKSFHPPSFINRCFVFICLSQIIKIELQHLAKFPILHVSRNIEFALNFIIIIIIMTALTCCWIFFLLLLLLVAEAIFLIIAALDVFVRRLRSWIQLVLKKKIEGSQMRGIEDTGKLLPFL